MGFALQNRRAEDSLKIDFDSYNEVLKMEQKEEYLKAFKIANWRVFSCHEITHYYITKMLYLGWRPV